MHICCGVTSCEQGRMQDSIHPKAAHPTTVFASHVDLASCASLLPFYERLFNMGTYMNIYIFFQVS